LLEVLTGPAVRNGQWQWLECVSTGGGNGSWDNFIACLWQDPAGERLLVAVNYSAHPSQCFVRLPLSDLNGKAWHLQDLLGDASYERDGTDLQARGLYLDVAPWQHHGFRLSPR